MKLSPHVFSAMGYKKLPEGESIEARFFILQIYTVSGISPVNDDSPIFNWKIDEVPLKFSVGNNLNSISKRLAGDDFTENLKEWEEESKSRPPYLARLIGPTKTYSAKDCYLQRNEGNLLTYDSFKEAKLDLQGSSSRLVPRLLTGLVSSFSSLPHGLDIDFVISTIFGETSEGERLVDLALTMSGTLQASSPLDEATLQSEVNKALGLADNIPPKAAEFFNLGLHEKDDLKAFLYYFLTIEVLTHHSFKTIDHKLKIHELIDPDDRIAKSSQLLFEIRSNSMKSLRDRFLWCAICTWGGITDNDVEEFSILKKTRDEIAHGAISRPRHDEVVRVKSLAQRLILQR